MKKIVFSLFAFTVLSVPCFLEAQAAENFKQEGIASWYGIEFEGRPTASGEIFDASQLTAAHPNLPFGTMLVVTNKHNNKSVTVRVNDRGPFVAARIIDVSRAAAEQLDMITTGTAPVLVESITKVTLSTPSQIQTVTSVVKPEETNVQPLNTIVPLSQSVVVQEGNLRPSGSVEVFTTQFPVQASNQIRLMPDINIAPDKIYRLQIGSYRVARNAVEAFEKLKNSGLNPSYERFINNPNGEYFRVVLAGVRGNDIQITAEKLKEAGFKEAVIREER